MNIFIENPTFWLPDTNNLAPKLPYAPMLFKRRLSALTKMTSEVLHALLEKDPDAKYYKDYFASNRGELSRQFAINKSLLIDGEISPASFSLSVFNTPIAQAAILLGLKAGYTVISAASNNIGDMLLAAGAAVKCGDEKKVVFIYADEGIPDVYNGCKNTAGRSGAFSCVVSGEYGCNSIALDTNKIFTLDNLLTLGKLPI